MSNTINGKHKDEAFGEEMQDLLDDALKGKTVIAFGPEGNGVWGSNPEVMSFTVSEVSITYADAKSKFVSIDVHLDDYEASSNGLIYTDKVFMASIQDLLNKASLGGDAVDYSEHDSQGDHAVNLDVSCEALTLMFS